MSDGDSFAESAGWLTQFRRGMIAGLSIPILGFAGLAIPVMLAWIVPGSDSVSATSALRAAALALLSGMHGGLYLGGVFSTVPPLTVTVALGWLICGPARRLDSTSGFVGLASGFTLCCIGLARWSRLGDTYAPVHRTAVASAAFVLVVGAASRWAPLGWARCSARTKRVLRAAAAFSACYFGLACVIVATQLVRHHGAAEALQAKVAPGIGGLAVLLLGVSVVPNAAVAVIGYLCGPGFDLGAHTSVSALSVSRGALPEFPLLAALPRDGGLSAIGLVLIAAAAVSVGVVAVGMLKSGSRGWAGMRDLASASAVFGSAVLATSVFARGGIGGGGLRSIGMHGWLAGPAAVALAASAGLLCSGVSAAMRLRRPSEQLTAPAPAAADDRADDGTADSAQASTVATAAANLGDTDEASTVDTGAGSTVDGSQRSTVEQLGETG